MREKTKILDEISALGAPPMELKNIPKSLAKKAQWRKANPMASTRLDALLTELAEVERAEQELASAERRLSGLQLSGIGPRALESATHAKPTQAMTVTKEWLANGRIWLLLCGNAGTGKTVAATWCVQNSASQGHSVAFRRFSEVAKLSGFGEGAEEIERLKRVRFLVIDDFSTDSVSGWARQVMLELLDFRHENHLRTIITANFKDARQAAECLGQRIADRIRQDGQVVFLNGASMRGAS